jgi:hypothetical protein
MLYTHTHVVVVHKGTTTFTVELLAGSIPPTSFSLFLFDGGETHLRHLPSAPVISSFTQTDDNRRRRRLALLLLCMHRRIFNNPVLPSPYISHNQWRTSPIIFLLFYIFLSLRVSLRRIIIDMYSRLLKCATAAVNKYLYVHIPIHIECIMFSSSSSSILIDKSFD